MTIKPLLCASLLAALCCHADPYDVPPGCPLEIPAPTPAQAPRDTLRLAFEICARQFYQCLVIYVIPRIHYDNWDAHVWVLQRSTTNYNNGQWENLSTKVAAITTTNAIAMFSDRIDRDEDNNPGIVYYRVVDMGSYVP